MIDGDVVGVEVEVNDCSVIGCEVNVCLWLLVHGAGEDVAKSSGKCSRRAIELLTSAEVVRELETIATGAVAKASNGIMK